MPYRKAGAGPAALYLEDDTLEYLDALLAAFHYPGADLYRVTGGDVRNFQILFRFNQ